MDTYIHDNGLRLDYLVTVATKTKAAMAYGKPINQMIAAAVAYCAS